MRIQTLKRFFEEKFGEFFNGIEFF